MVAGAMQLINWVGYQQPSPTGVGCDSVLMCPGEDLLYEVSWWVFKLGQIRVKTLESKRKDGELRYTAAAFVDSYEGLPFVDLHAIDYTEMDTAFYSRGFNSLEKKNDRWLYEISHYDLPNKMLIIEKAWQKDPQSSPESPHKFDTVRIAEATVQDGLSILYFARANIRRNQTVRVPTVVYGRPGFTECRFRKEKNVEEIDAFKKPVRVVELEGRAEFEGIFGLTGDFMGWFSDDAAAVPIKAEMQVILGSINIELKKWERKGWDPPLEQD